MIRSRLTPVFLTATLVFLPFVATAQERKGQCL